LSDGDVMERLGDEVGRELRRFGPAAGMSGILEAWPAAVGDAIARNAWPARIARDGTLHVATSSSAWAFELAQLGEEIGSRLARAVGDEAPKRLRFAPGNLPERRDESVKEAARERPNPSPATLEQAREIAATIGDSELRELVARAAAASLAGASDDRPL
jgi:hypothetical protein